MICDLSTLIPDHLSSGNIMLQNYLAEQFEAAILDTLFAVLCSSGQHSRRDQVLVVVLVQAQQISIIMINGMFYFYFGQTGKKT